MKRMSLALLLILSAGAARAQWVPVTGRITTTTEVIASDGTVATKWTTKSRYSRSASGSVLIQRLGRSGKPATATLLDYGNSGKAYTLTYSTGQIHDIRRPLNARYATQPPTGMTAEHKKVTLGNETLDAVATFKVPIYDTGPNRSRILIGKAWLAPAYNNLIMKEEVTRTEANGSKRHIVRVFKIKDQKEPDVTLFARDRKTIKGQWKQLPPEN
jgi:hypothetical protein